MKLVSENSEAELARRQAIDKVRLALRELAANLMRIVRGDGKPWEVGQQAQELVNTLVAYREACGHMPDPDEITAALSIEDKAGGLSDVALDRLDARDTIVRGCLQIAASELLSQNTQLAAGWHEMHEGIRNLEDVRERKLPTGQRPQSRADGELKRRIQEARANMKARPRTKKPQP